MTDTTLTTEAAHIIEAARLGVIPTEFELGAIYGAIQADGSVKIIDLATDDHRKRLGEVPVRKTGHANLTEPTSFAHYIRAHAEPLRTALFADRDAGRIVALLNTHTADADGEAGWGDHRATLTLRQTPGWAAWTQASGKLVDQIQFAEFLEDRAADVVDPDAARLLEIATSIEATTSAAMKSASRLDNGEVKLRYEETIDARAGQAGDLTIPSRIELALSPYEGMDPYKVTARFRYRLNNGSLRLGIVLDRPEDILRAAFGDVTGLIETTTSQVVLHGTPLA